MRVRCDNCYNEVDISKAVYEEIKKSVQAEIAAEANSKIEELQNALAELENSSSFKDVEKAALEAKLKNLESAKEMDFEKRIVVREAEIREQVRGEMEGYRKALDETSGLLVKEKEETIRQLQEKLSEAQQKASQGSMQLQGEAQELLIEEYLKEQFPLDSIMEIKKGALGGDTFHTVNTRDAVGIGTIYYESKRTKAFNNQWLDKFKQDMIAKGADAGILVTTARPTGSGRAEQIKGIWVCSMEEFKILCHAVRAKIIAVHEARATQENKADKMDLMYNYLTSTEFRMQVEAIVEGFSQMQEDLASEKRSMNAIWSKREKQIAKVIDNTIGMYGSIKGIGGSAIGDIKSLELK